MNSHSLKRLMRSNKAEIATVPESALSATERLTLIPETMMTPPAPLNAKDAERNGLASNMQHFRVYVPYDDRIKPNMRLIDLASANDYRITGILPYTPLGNPYPIAQEILMTLEN